MRKLYIYGSTLSHNANSLINLIESYCIPSVMADQRIDFTAGYTVYKAPRIYNPTCRSTFKDDQLHIVCIINES